MKAPETNDDLIQSVRMTLVWVEAQIEHMRTDIKDIKAGLARHEHEDRAAHEKLFQQIVAHNSQNSKGKWQLLTALTTGIMALVGMVIQAITT